MKSSSTAVATQALWQEFLTLLTQCRAIQQNLHQADNHRWFTTDLEAIDRTVPQGVHSQVILRNLPSHYEMGWVQS